MNESGRFSSSDTAFGLDNFGQKTEAIVRPRELEETLRKIDKILKKSKSSGDLDVEKLQELLRTFLDNTADVSDYFKQVDTFDATNKVFVRDNLILKAYEDHPNAQATYDVSQNISRMKGISLENIVLALNHESTWGIQGYTLAERVLGPSFGQLYRYLARRPEGKEVSNTLVDIQLLHNAYLQRYMGGVRTFDESDRQKMKSRIRMDFLNVIRRLTGYFSLNGSDDVLEYAADLVSHEISKGELVHYTDRNQSNIRLRGESDEVTHIPHFDLRSLLLRSVSIDFDKLSKITNEQENLIQIVDGAGLRFELDDKIEMLRKHLFLKTVDLQDTQQAATDYLRCLSTDQLPPLSLDYIHTFQFTRIYRNLRSSANRIERNYRRILRALSIDRDKELLIDKVNVCALVDRHIHNVQQALLACLQTECARSDRDIHVNTNTKIQYNGQTVTQYKGIFRQAVETQDIPIQRIMSLAYLRQLLEGAEIPKINTVEVLTRNTISLADVFGPPDQQICKREGRPCKPDNRIWEELQTHPYIYIGDSVTDVRFIEGIADVRGVIVPKKNLVDKVFNYVEKKQLDDKITITTNQKLYTVVESLIAQCEGSRVTVAFDLDDTVFPKFREAQMCALRTLLSTYSDIIPEDYITQLNTRHSLPVNIQGFENKLVLLLKYIMTPQQPTNFTSAVSKYAMDEIVAKNKDRLGEVVKEVNDFLGDDVFTYDSDTQVNSDRLRALETEFTVQHIREGKAFIYHGVHQLFQLTEKYPNLDFTIITNKPDTILYKIYPLRFEIK